MMFRHLKKSIKLNIFQPLWNTRGWFPYFGDKVFFPKNSIIFQRTVIEGIYEIDILDIIFPLIKPDTTVFDIGANIGIMALPILDYDRTIKLISIEASPNTLPYLKKTNAASKDLRRWTVIDKAVSDIAKKVNFHLADASIGAYDSINDTKRVKFSKTVEVDCTTIDTIWQDKGVPEVSFIKIDIEGADLLALRGGVNCIKSCRPAILLEWNLMNIKPFNLVNQDFFDFFQSINYSCFTVPALNKVTTLSDLELYSRLQKISY